MAITASLVKELRERTGLGMMECKKALVAVDGDLEKAIDELRKSGQTKAAKKAGRTAAEGVVVFKIADDAKSALMLEVNSETDFVARDENFLGFVSLVLNTAFERKETNIAQLMKGDLEQKRLALIQKIGENISVRRAQMAKGDLISGYIHGNSRIAVLTVLTGGTAELAKDVSMHIAAVNPQVVRKEDMPAAIVEKEKEIFRAQAESSGKPAEIIEKMIVGRVNKFLAESSLLEQPFVKNPDVTVGRLANEKGANVESFIRFEVGEGIEKEEVDFAAEVRAQAGLS